MFFVLYCPGFSGTAFGSFRVPASLGPSPLLCFLCFSVLASLGQLLFCWVPGFSGSLPIIVFLCFTVPASLGQLLVLLGSRLLWVPPQPLCASAFLSRLLWDSFSRVLAYLGPFPSFLEMHGLGDFDAPLDSVALISLIECISRALAAAASRLLWELLFC